MRLNEVDDVAFVVGLEGDDVDGEGFSEGDGRGDDFGEGGGAVDLGFARS